MKIGIDISQVVYGGGVSVYTQNLVNHLLKIDQQNQYILFFSSLRKKIRSEKWKVKSKNAKCKIFKLPPTLLDILWNRFHICPIEFFIGNVDVFHSSDWTQPPVKKAKRITTIHDLSFLRWPKTVHPKVLAVQKRRLGWVKREIDHIIAVSQATKQEIITLLGINPEKITVIYEGLPEEVKNLKIKNEKLKVIKDKFGITKPYLFTYGSKAPRKNISQLVKVFKESKEIKKNFQLVITGDFQPAERLPDQIILTDFLPREEMLTLFSQAEVFVYPSLYEGFGLPILEAFALKVPVVTSNLSSMAEIAQGAAVLINPRSTKEIKEGILKALRKKDELIRAGKKRLKLFSWEKTAKETLKVYQKLINN